MRDKIGTESAFLELSETLDGLEATDLAHIALGHGAKEHAPTHRYDVRGCLGSGGLGEVFEVFDYDLRRAIALKVPHVEAPSKASTLVVREAQITAQLEHPCIPSVHALGVQADGRPFFTMTCVRGQTLGELIRAGTLTEQRALRIFVQFGYAVAFAHERGVVHRDLKPENVMLGAFGEVRLMDWGIAKVMNTADEVPQIELSEEAQRETRVGSFVGTPGFAAPEQIEGRKDLDARADIFAMGVMLYEMLTGESLVEGSALARLERTLDPERDPVVARKGLAMELAAVINRATSFAREARYASVLEMIRDVEAYLDGEAVRAFKPTAWQRIRFLYLMRGSRARRLSAFDMDIIIGGHAVMGVGFGCMIFAYFGVPSFWIGLALTVVSFAVTGIPAWTLFRPERADDLRRTTSLSEGLRSNAPSWVSMSDDPSSQSQSGKDLELGDTELAGLEPTSSRLTGERSTD